jgi:ribonuclease HII
MANLAPYLHRKLIEAGCDEAGRGCLAGPVVAAAVILPKKFKHELLNDSKKMTEAHRKLLAPIIEKEALAFAVGIVSEIEIDQINILNASFLAMHRAIDQLSLMPEHLLIDGNRFKKYSEIEHTCIIKGDGKYLSIAAASVIAKTYRDTIMEELDKDFPLYGWNKSKGYPTKMHREAIEKHGPTKHHRMSFTLLPPIQFALNFED